MSNSFYQLIGESDNYFTNTAGDLGIGGAPSARLHVQKLEQADVSIKITNETTGHEVTDGLDVGLLQNGTGRLWQRDAFDLLIGTDDTPRITIGASGTVTVHTGLDVSESLNVSEALNVDGSVTFGGTLTGIGNSSLGNLSLSGTLDVTGATSLATATIASADVNGGTINGATIGQASAAAGSFTTLGATQAITSTLATGNAPFVVASTTKVTNLNADLLDGSDWASPANIGATTPGTGTFTTLTATGGAVLASSQIGAGANAFGEKLTVTQAGITAYLHKNDATTGACIIVRNNGSQGATAATQISFMNSSAVGVGSIASSGSATSYNTASDYRLKFNVVVLADAVDRVKSLPVHRFNWLADPEGSQVDGFLAHEAEAVVPESVLGTKDAVDGEGSPVYQAIDQSKLVPVLWAAVQEIVARVEALEA